MADEQVNIRERDLTSSDADLFNDYVVFVPGKIGASATLESGKTEITYDDYKGDIDTFKDLIGDTDESGVIPPSGLAPKIAEYLIGLGAVIIYKVITADTDVEKESFWKPYYDRANYDIRFFTLAGLDSKIGSEFMVKAAAERGDAVALVDVPKASCTDSATASTWLNALTLGKVTRYGGYTEYISKYGAGFASWWKFGDETDYYPGSFHYLTCFLGNVAGVPDWFAMAGPARGVSPFTNVATQYNFGDADIQVLQPREISEGTKICGNIICLRKPYGKVLWGNRTLFPLGLPNDSGKVQKGLCASSFLNIRHLCCNLKKTLYRASNEFMFDPNSDTLWINFKSRITPLLEEMKSGQGIRGYDIIRQRSTKKAALMAKIQIIPIEAVEAFYLDVELSDTINVSEE